jgi:hypothetical protein
MMLHKDYDRWVSVEKKNNSDQEFQVARCQDELNFSKPRADFNLWEETFGIL